MGLRRVLVAVQDGQNTQKLALSMKRDATIADLAEEIIVAMGVPAVRLEVGDGFVLQGKDPINSISDGEVVTARVLPEENAERQTVVEKQDETMSDLRPPKVKVRHKPAHEIGTGRLRITLMSAGLGRTFSAQNPDTWVLPSNGMKAFGGEFVNGDTPLTAVRREAARIFGWDSNDSMNADESCTHSRSLACSCAIAEEIAENGLRCTMHCRLSLNGTHCHRLACPYSHVSLGLADDTAESDLTCSICSESLVSPCPKCLRESQHAGKQLNEIISCSLTQNVGCHHIHHTHCLGKLSAGISAGCPSGCPRDVYPREAKGFGTDEPHLVLVWDGDKIVRLPIPLSHIQAGSPICLKSEVIVNIIQEYLRSQDCEVGGLVLRIHGRDPVSETTRFTQSTLVSVCSTSEHDEYSANCKFFGLFPDKTLPATSRNHFEDGSGSFVDLHTLQTPIVACGCTTLQQLFNLGPAGSLDVTLYAVKRNTEKDDNGAYGRFGSKESTYLATSAWQPSIKQSTRGLSALLSSLYVLAHSVSMRGNTAEQVVLWNFYALTRFPPAVRSLGMLFSNKNLEVWEKAGLSEALFYVTKELAVNGPSSITKAPDRTFETSRIFLGQLMSLAAESPSEDEDTQELIEEVSLRCGLSRKRLVEPMTMSESILVETSTAMLYMNNGELVPPNSSDHDFTEVWWSYSLCQILSHSRGLNRAHVSVLQLEKVGNPPESAGLDLKTLARNFVLAINNANGTDLVSRGPLDLKSTNVVPPQIVVDSEGLLSVFTGRGCGATKDVNFFRPVRGGDTEVDVNDVGHALEKVIWLRKAEKTWDVDSFSVPSAHSRPPAEAIMICLDLSESMNKKSAVSNPNPGDKGHDKFNVDIEAAKAVAELVAKEGRSDILVKAKKYLEELHPACHHAWKLYIEGEPQARRSEAPGVLLQELQKIAKRDVLRLSSDLEEDPAHEYARTDKLSQLACLAQAVADHPDELSSLLVTLASTTDQMFGHEPYQVPRNLLDSKSGDLFNYPVHPMRSPSYLFMNKESCAWFDAQVSRPTGYFVPPVAASTKHIQGAVNRWVSGIDLLHPKPLFAKRSDDEVDIIFTDEGKSRTWCLPIHTPVRTIYMLVHRATRAKYATFTIRLASTKAVISDSTTTTIGVTDLSRGGEIEVSMAVPHQRKLIEFKIVFDKFRSLERTVLLPAEAPALAITFYLKGVADFSKLMLWHGMEDAGDGVRQGSPLYNEETLTGFRRTAKAVKLECSPWFYLMSGSILTRRNSRHLSRLHLMSELFNVFINRASSFDTSVALVLGLVTFSDHAQVKQPLTPIFEDFRRELATVEASGDTAVYDALEVAKNVLVDYRTELPHLRRRIIIVSDGDDTSSTASPVTLCKGLQMHGIVVDSVQVGPSHNETLHAISVATGGYRFFPKTSLGDALSIFDLETMLNSAERPRRHGMPFISSSAHLRNYATLSSYPIDVVTADKFPQRLEHPKLKGSVSAASETSRLPLLGDERMKRIMLEIRRLVSSPHPHIDVYINDQDMSFFKIVMEAPNDIAECPYKGGTFLLTCDLPAGYPRDPPEFRFVTFILHPNVSKQGKVCVAELSRLWSSDITLMQALSQIYGLLLEPDLENPLEIQASLKYYDDDGTYALAAADAVKGHASKNRAQWRAELAPGSS